MANINDVRTTNNPQRAYEFEVSFTGSSRTGNYDQSTTRVNSVTIPPREIEPIQINYKASNTQHAGRDATTKTVVVNYWDDESNGLYKFFAACQSIIIGQTNGGGVDRGEYAFQLTVRELAADSETISLTHTFTNVWVQSLGERTLSYDTSDRVNFDVTFSYDEKITE